MTRVAVTGLGIVSPLGLDAPTTWRTAVAGQSGIDWISAFETDGLPIRIAAEVRGFDPLAVASPKDAFEQTAQREHPNAEEASCSGPASETHC